MRATVKTQPEKSLPETTQTQSSESENQLSTQEFADTGAVQFLRTPPRSFDSPHYRQQNLRKTQNTNVAAVKLNTAITTANNELSSTEYDRTRFRYSRRTDWKYNQIMRTPAQAHQEQPVAAILPPSENFIHVITLHIIDVLNGQRPAKHLRSWMSPQAYQALLRRSRLGLEIHGGAAKCAAPQVRKIRLFQPTPRSAEAAVVLFDGRRIRGAALRLETCKDRWVIAEIEVI